MKKIIALAAALSSLSVAAQDTGISVTASNAADNSLVFKADANGYGTFTVRLAIDDIRNSLDGKTNTVVIAAAEGNATTELLTISPLDGSIPVTASCKWDWLQGKLDPIPDLGFVYRLPVADGRAATVRSLTPAEAGMVRDNVSAFLMWQFSMEENDPVFAIRKGMVIYVQGYGDRTHPGGGSIIVEHADGTQARYDALGEESALVAPGDTVYPDTQIATAGKLPGGGYGAQVGLYYYATNRNRGAHPHMMAQTNFINPIFMTAAGENILQDGERAVAKTTKRVLEAESGRKSFWQRLFGR